MKSLIFHCLMFVGMRVFGASPDLQDSEICKKVGENVGNSTFLQANSEW